MKLFSKLVFTNKFYVIRLCAIATIYSLQLNGMDTPHLTTMPDDIITCILYNCKYDCKDRDHRSFASVNKEAYKICQIIKEQQDYLVRNCFRLKIIQKYGPKAQVAQKEFENIIHSNDARIQYLRHTIDSISYAMTHKPEKNDKEKRIDKYIHQLFTFGSLPIEYAKTFLAHMIQHDFVWGKEICIRQMGRYKDCFAEIIKQKSNTIPSLTHENHSVDPALRSTRMLINAIDMRNTPCVKLLYRYGCIALTSDDLLLAIQNHDYQMAATILKCETVRNNFSDYFLIYAVASGNSNVCKLILQFVRDVNTIWVDSNGNIATPLSMAVENNDVDVTKLLLMHPSITLRYNSRLMDSPLLIAARYGSTETIKLLLTASTVDVNIKSLGGLTPLMIAATHGHLEIVKLLLTANNLDLTAQDMLGRTALELAEIKGEYAIAYLLHSHSAQQDNF